MNAQMLTADGWALFLTAFVDLIPSPSAKIGREASSITKRLIEIMHALQKCICCQAKHAVFFDLSFL